MDGIPPAVKSALTRAYNKGSSSRTIRSADLITLPGIKKAPKKRVAAMLEPVENLAESAENEEESVSDAEEQGIIFDSIKQISNLIVGCCFCDGLNCLCASFSLLVP